MYAKVTLYSNKSTYKDRFIINRNWDFNQLFEMERNKSVEIISIATLFSVEMVKNGLG
jgi:hypothetical protein